jgi:hypothetical protein
MACRKARDIAAAPSRVLRGLDRGREAVGFLLGAFDERGAQSLIQACAAAMLPALIPRICLLPSIGADLTVAIAGALAG